MPDGKQIVKIISTTDILDGLANKTIDPMSLSSFQRKNCIKYFLSEKPRYKQSQIGAILKISKQAVWRYRKQIIRENIPLVKQLDAYAVGADLFVEQEALIAELRAEGKWKQAAEVREKLINMLMELNVIPRAPKRIEAEVNGDITFSEFVRLAHEARSSRDENNVPGRFQTNGRGVSSVNRN